MTCTFTIVPPSNKSSSTYTKLSFLERFVVEPEANCGYDYLQITTSSSIYQGSSITEESLFICGVGLPADVIVYTAQEVTLTFISDRYVQGEGFAVQVTFGSGSRITSSAYAVAVFLLFFAVLI